MRFRLDEYSPMKIGRQLTWNLSVVGCLPVSTGSQDNTAGGVTTTQLVQRMVGLGKGQHSHLAVNLPCGSHSEHFLQVLSSPDRGCLDPDFSSCHQNRREADVFGRQAHDK